MDSFEVHAVQNTAQPTFGVCNSWNQLSQLGCMLVCLSLEDLTLYVEECDQFHADFHDYDDLEYRGKVSTQLFLFTCQMWGKLTRLRAALEGEISQSQPGLSLILF
jgi:hypothetical protein